MARLGAMVTPYVAQVSLTTRIQFIHTDVQVYHQIKNNKLFFYIIGIAQVII